jgi:tRNA-Thr(GGU) m(6)t(6)A37 methyltransferase TsaA
MMNNMGEMKIIARIHTDFGGKFGVPRQSGLVDSLEGEIVFEPEFRSPEAVRGIDSYSRLWLIWEFSENLRDSWSPTVRPPRLGGNTRMGVFATRSPFRPNPIGLSCVELESVELDARRGPVLHVRGADMVDGTPIFDIKPYVPYADCHPEARAGMAQLAPEARLAVDIPPELCAKLPEEKLAALRGVLACDPRPPYQSDESRVYGLTFAGRSVKFTVFENKLTVTDILPEDG